MICSVCKREMSLLLVSYACDYCDGPAPTEFFAGYIVYQPERIGTGSPIYVFPSQADASVWRSKCGLQAFELREVHSHLPFTWKTSVGAIAEIRLANRAFEVFEDHRYEPRPNRAYLAPQA